MLPDENLSISVFITFSYEGNFLPFLVYLFFIFESEHSLKFRRKFTLPVLWLSQLSKNPLHQYCYINIIYNLALIYF